MQAYDLSIDHKPDLEAEEERILEADIWFYRGRAGQWHFKSFKGYRYLTFLWTPDPSLEIQSLVLRLWIYKWLYHRAQGWNCSVFHIEKHWACTAIQKHVCNEPPCALPLTPVLSYSCLCLYILDAHILLGMHLNERTTTLVCIYLWERYLLSILHIFVCNAGDVEFKQNKFLPVEKQIVTADPDINTVCDFYSLLCFDSNKLLS